MLNSESKPKSKLKPSSHPHPHPHLHPIPSSPANANSTPPPLPPIPRLLLRPPLPLPNNLLLNLLDAPHRTLTAPQANEAAQPPALVLQTGPRVPVHRTRIVARIGPRRALVVEVRQFIQLRASQQPEVQQRRGERRVCGPRG